MGILLIYYYNLQKYYEKNTKISGIFFGFWKKSDKYKLCFEGKQILERCHGSCRNITELFHGNCVFTGCGLSGPIHSQNKSLTVNCEYRVNITFKVALSYSFTDVENTPDDVWFKIKKNLRKKKKIIRIPFHIVVWYKFNNISVT